MHHYFCLSAIFSHKDFVNFCSYFYSVQCYADVDNNDFLLLKLVTQYHLLISWWWRIHGCLWVSMSVYVYFTDDFFFVLCTFECILAIAWLQCKQRIIQKNEHNTSMFAHNACDWFSGLFHRLQFSFQWCWSAKDMQFFY